MLQSVNQSINQSINKLLTICKGSVILPIYARVNNDTCSRLLSGTGAAW